MEYIPSFYSCLSEEDITGLQAIKYIFFTINVKLNEPFNSADIESFIEKTRQKYNDYNIQIDLPIYKITAKLFSLISSIDNNKVNKLTLLNDIFEYYLKNSNQLITKDISKYYSTQILNNWILKLGNPNISDQLESIFVGNLKINSYIDIIIDTCKKKKISWNKVQNKIFGHQSNEQIKSLQLTNMSLNYQKKFDQNISSTNLLVHDINLPVQSFDLIYWDFPTGIHNIIHASCCNKIKKLKLRGTKSEPLLLQLVMESLNKDGRAVLIIPDSLLFSDSIQPIETRKYLMEHFNVKKVIQIDDSLYMNKGNKNSILYFENNGVTNNIEFSKIVNSGNQIEIISLFNISINKIKENIYSLYWKNYEPISTFDSKNEIKIISFNDIYEIKTTINPNSKNKFICLDKYYKNDKSISIGPNSQSNWEYYIELKNPETSNFNIELLENILRTKHSNLVKGKMNQFDLNKIAHIEIPIMSDLVKNSVSEYINITNQLISESNDKIANIQKLKSCLINSIYSDNMIAIENISTIHQTNQTNQTNKLIGITRNGLSAGFVYMVNANDELLTNSHYLKITKENYLLDYVYHYLKHNEIKIKELANLNYQSNLSQSNLLNFKIPDLSLQNQIEIANTCNDFDLIINKYLANNKFLMEKDIMSTILKINNIKLFN